MGFPECKAGSDWQVQNREQKEGEKEGSNVDGQVCAGNVKLGSVSFQGGEQKSQLCVQRHWCQPDQIRRWARRAETCAEQLKASSARTQPVKSSMVLGRQTKYGPV